MNRLEKCIDLFNFSHIQLLYRQLCGWKIFFFYLLYYFYIYMFVHPLLRLIILQIVYGYMQYFFFTSFCINGFLVECIYIFLWKRRLMRLIKTLTSQIAKFYLSSKKSWLNKNFFIHLKIHLLFIYSLWYVIK